MGFLAQAVQEFEALMSLRRANPILPQAVTGFGPVSLARPSRPNQAPNTNQPTGEAELDVDFFLTGSLLWFHAEICGILKYRTTRRLDRSWHSHTISKRTN